MGLSDQDRALRQKFKDAVKSLRGCDDADAEVILHRIADRLGGCTHAEVKQMHPLPEISEAERDG